MEMSNDMKFLARKILRLEETFDENFENLKDNILKYVLQKVTQKKGIENSTINLSCKTFHITQKEVRNETSNNIYDLFFNGNISIW